MEMQISPVSSFEGEDTIISGEPGPTTEKPSAKRSRTGCLTCRGRHLKCDEGKPECGHCKKGNRPCEWGLVLKFKHKNYPIVKNVRNAVPIRKDYKAAPGEWRFEDNSVTIASEYVGGLEQYGYSESTNVPLHDVPDFSHDLSGTLPQLTEHLSYSSPSTMTQRSYTMGGPADHLHSLYAPGPATSLPPIQGLGLYGNQDSSPYSTSPGGPVYFPVQYPTPMVQTLSRRPAYISSTHELYLTKAFVNEVASWMDTTNPTKYFAEIVPWKSLSNPILGLAMCACGFQHLKLVNSKYESPNGETPEQYYQEARQLLDKLGHSNSPGTDSREIQAIASTILNVYETYSKSSPDRMAGFSRTRELLHKCGWNSQAINSVEGPAAACFWLQRGMELLSCLHFGIPVTWDTIDWKDNLESYSSLEIGRHREYLWMQRVIYIVIRITNFLYASREATPEDASARFSKWNELKAELEDWDARKPATMGPIAFIEQGNPIFQSVSEFNVTRSRFPQIYIPNKTGVFTQIFYNTGMILLGKSYPYVPEDMHIADMILSHSRTICGIVRNIEDRGLASVAIRSSALAAEFLKDHDEQDEMLEVLRSFEDETGWRIGFLRTELMAKWGRPSELTIRTPSTSASSATMMNMTMPPTPSHTGTSPIDIQAATQHLHIPPTLPSQVQTTHSMASTHQNMSPYHSAYGSTQSSHSLPMIQTSSPHTMPPPMTSPHAPISLSPHEPRPYHQSLMQLTSTYQNPVGSTGAITASHITTMQAPHQQQMHSLSMPGLPSHDTQYGPY